LLAVTHKGDVITLQVVNSLFISLVRAKRRIRFAAVGRVAGQSLNASASANTWL
jgi:hypothetical protein